MIEGVLILNVYIDESFCPWLRVSAGYIPECPAVVTILFNITSLITLTILDIIPNTWVS